MIPFLYAESLKTPPLCPSAPLPLCGLNDKSLTGHDITNHLSRYCLKSNLENSDKTTRSLLSIPITEPKAIASIFTFPFLLALTRTS